MGQSNTTTRILDDAGVVITSLSDGGTENGLAVSQVATNFVFSTVNSTVVQLAAGAVFNGTPESVINQQAVSVLLTCDQACTIVIKQWIGSGTGLISSWSFAVPAGTGFSRAFTANGNYISFSVTNNGAVTTTTLNLNVAYGTLPAATNLGNAPVAVSEVNGNALVGDPVGAVPTTIEPTSLIYEDFTAALDTVNKWSTVGTFGTSSGGVLTLPTTATSGSITTIPTFTIQSSEYFVPNWNVKLEAAAATGTGRFWGLGTVATTPAVNSLAQEGAGFQIDTTGVLQAVTYTGGVKTVVATLPRPTDNAFHRYGLIFRAALTIWTFDGNEVARATQLNIATQTVSGQVSYFSAAVTGTPQTVIAAFGIGDRSRLHTYIADATYPWRRAQVGKSGGVSVKGASVAGTSGNIAAAGTGTVGPLDISEAGNVTFIAKNQTAGTAWAGAPVLVFEQSDDSVSWSPLLVVRNDNNQVASTHTLPANAANVEYIFDAAAESINWVRCRVTTGPTTNPMTVAINGGGMAFSPVVTTVPHTNVGRVRISAASTSAGTTAGATGTDTLMTLANFWRNGVSVGQNTSFPITANKTFRITSFGVYLKNNAAAVAVATFTLRYNPTGAATNASEPVAVLFASLPATSGVNSFATLPIGDGIDLPGGTTPGQFCVTCLPTFASTAPGIFASITGYEY